MASITSIPTLVRQPRTPSAAAAAAGGKPRLRGWLHLGLTPIALVSGADLVAHAPTTAARLGTSVFVLTSVLLFGVSATYHRGTWSARTHERLRRLDHADIYLAIAGSFTAFALLLLRGERLVLLLALLWGGALLGAGVAIAWAGAPRGVHTPAYVLLGLVVAAFSPSLVEGARRIPAVAGTVLTLMAVAAALAAIGGAVYALRRPDPWPDTFGFHEVFHALTVAAFGCEVVALLLATHAVR